MNTLVIILISYFIFAQKSSQSNLHKGEPSKREWKPIDGGGLLLNGCYEIRPSNKCSLVTPTTLPVTIATTPTPVPIGTEKNPATSCKAILENNRLSPNGVYFIKTPPTVTKVYCYMTPVPGCGTSGGWTTLLKIDGKKQTFRLQSRLWSNKMPYLLTNGQSGPNDKETKLPTYWTLPFKSLCLGMKVTSKLKPKWIKLDYRATSLYSVIEDGKERRFTIGRTQWKTLIANSSLQMNCNKEGFNVLQKARIGIFSNQENDCLSPDSYIAFGALSGYCSGRSTTGNCAASSHSDNGLKITPAYGYVLAQ